MNANDLELKISGLEKVIQEKTADTNRYQDELKVAQKQLVDYNKPELTTEMMGEIEGAVEEAVRFFDFNDTDNYEIDYSLDYDGRVQCEAHEFINDADLCSIIVNRVCNLFKEIEDDKTND